MLLFKVFENTFTLVTCIVGLVFIGFIWGGILAVGGDFWTVISCVISFLSLLCVVFIYGKWEEQILITKRHDEYQECLLLLIRFSTLSQNLITTKQHEYWFLSQDSFSQNDICDQLVGAKGGSRPVIEARKAFNDINLEMICRRELMSAMLGGGSNCFFKSFESFRSITAALANSNYELTSSGKAELRVHCSSTYSVLDDSKFKSMLDNWDFKYSGGELAIEFNLNDYSKLHDSFKGFISCSRDDFRELSILYIQNIT